MKKIMCKKLNKECEALDYLPYPGELGKRIQENISREGWEQWVSHQTMLINEMRLTPVDPKGKKILEEEMEKFFFGDGSQTLKVLFQKNNIWPGSSVGRAVD